MSRPLRKSSSTTKPNPAIFAPEDSASLHLKALARVSRLFKDSTFRQRLMDAPDGAELYRLLKEEDNKY